MTKKTFPIIHDRREEDALWQAYTRYVVPLRKRVHTSVNDKDDIQALSSNKAEQKVTKWKNKTVHQDVPSFSVNSKARTQWHKLSSLHEKKPFPPEISFLAKNNGYSTLRKKTHSSLERPIGVRQPGIDTYSWQRLENGRMTPLRKLDLHGEKAHIAFQKLHAFILHAYMDNIRCIEIITGIGGGIEGGILKRELPAWLERPDIQMVILASVYASPSNKGAVRLLLRRKEKMRSHTLLKSR